MDINSATHTVDEEHAKVEVTDDSCGIDYIEIVPLTSDDNGSLWMECVDGDWSTEFRQVDLASAKQERDDVCILKIIYLLLLHKVVRRQSR